MPGTTLNYRDRSTLNYITRFHISLNASQGVSAMSRRNETAKSSEVWQGAFKMRKPRVLSAYQETCTVSEE